MLPMLYMSDSDLIPIPIYHVALNLLGKDIDTCGGKLPSADAFLKEQIQLGKSTSSRFRDSEICVDKAEEARSSLASPLVSECR